MSGGVAMPGNIYVDASKAEFTRDKTTSLGFFSNNLGISAVEGEGVDGYEGHGNIHWVGGVFYGNSKDNDSLNFQFMAFGHARNIVVENCVFHDHCGPGHAIELAGVENVVIKNCSFLGYNPTYLSNGEATTNETWKEAIQFEPVTNGGFWFANYDFTPTRNVTIDSCTFGPSVVSSLGAHFVAIGTHWTTLLNSGEPTVHDIIVTNCHFESLQKVAIHNYAIEKLVVSNNTFHNCGRVFRLTRMTIDEAAYQDGTSANRAIPCKNMLFTNNIISDDATYTYIPIDTAHDVADADIATDTYLHENITISNNIFTRPSHVYDTVYFYLMQVGSIRNLKIDSNVFDWYTEIAIMLRYHCENVKFTNNELKHFTQQGFLAWGSTQQKNLLIANNFISGDFVSGVFAAQPIRLQTVKGLNILNNYIKSAITYPGHEANVVDVTSTCEDGLVSGNVIDSEATSSSTYDLYITSGNKNIAIGENICLNTGGVSRFYTNTGTKDAGKGLIRGSSHVIRENGAKYGTL